MERFFSFHWTNFTNGPPNTPTNAATSKSGSKGYLRPAPVTEAEATNVQEVANTSPEEKRDVVDRYETRRRDGRSLTPHCFGANV